ncbi:hypothetical protein GGI20_005216 [Coemansia sp. BCRC 34301]|nr:hypothetical protein GGI20_005216 [Coemansia sp. BCRC 34301]
MPRPKRKAATTKPAAKKAAIPKDHAPAMPSTGKTLTDSGIEDEEESPSKRMRLNDVGASPGKSPKVTTPRYGRRISSGIARQGRRLTFDGERRTSGASDLVFDGLLDGFSPIKRNAPPETLDDEDLPQPEEVLSTIPQEKAAADNEESDSELFDIDTLLVAHTHKPKSGAPLTFSSLNDTSEADLLPRRTRSQAPKPGAVAASKPVRGRTAGRTRKQAVVNKDQTSSSEEEDADDSWKPAKAAASTTVTHMRRPRKAAGKRASAKTKDSKPAAASAWNVDPKTAKYFDDIDGFELTEEAV